MQILNNIAKCEFFIDVARITLIKKNPKMPIFDELSKWLKFQRSIPTDKLDDYRGFKNDYSLLSKFRCEPITKCHLLHGKKNRFQNIDALLILHDVPLYELLKIQAILERLRCVADFNLSFVEFRWDFYPDGSAVDFQQHIVGHLFLMNARTAFSIGKRPRITFYINSSVSDVFMKTYIRPKEEDSGKQEFVRIELSAKRRWLKNIGLTKPSDFRNFEIGKVLTKIQWLDVDHEKISRSYLNLLSGKRWQLFVNKTLPGHGIALVITENRMLKECSNRCKKRGSAECHLAENALLLGVSSTKKIQSCKNAKLMTDFSSRFCMESSTKDQMNALMKKAYFDWKMKRQAELIKKTGMQILFPIRAHISPLKHRKKTKQYRPDFKMTSIW